MIKVTLAQSNSKTIPMLRSYRIREYKDLNEFRINFFGSKTQRLDNIGKEFDSSMKINSFNYRKLMETYFEPYE
jgi:hypothetical protein